MKVVQCYELFGGIALKIHTFSFSFFFIHPWGFFLSADFLRDSNSGCFLYTINEGLQLGGRVCHGFEERLKFS